MFSLFCFYHLIFNSLSLWTLHCCLSYIWHYTDDGNSVLQNIRHPNRRLSQRLKINRKSPALHCVFEMKKKDLYQIVVDMIKKFSYIFIYILPVHIQYTIESFVEHEIWFAWIRFLVCDFHIFQIFFKCIFQIIINQCRACIQPWSDRLLCDRLSIT